MQACTAKLFRCLKGHSRGPDFARPLPFIFQGVPFLLNLMRPSSSFLLAFVLACVLGVAPNLGCDSNSAPVIITYNAFGEGIESVTSIQYRNATGRLVREANPSVPFSIILNVGQPLEDQEAEITVSALVGPGGRLSTGVIVSRSTTITDDVDTVEQEGQAASLLTVSSSLPLP